MTYKVKIDPGHGGSDPGAGGYNILEKDVVLRIAKYMKDHLDKYYPAINASLTRTKDVFLSLNKRTDTANRERVDVLVSIHINSTGKKDVRGFETFRFSGTSGATARLQCCVHDAIMEVNKKFGVTRDRGKKMGNLHMVRESNMPATLTENLFISNVDDNNLLKNGEYVKALGIAHAEGVAAFFGFPIIKVGTSEPKREETKQNVPKDTRKYRLMTGAFPNAEALADGIERLKKDYGWLTYEKADSTELNPTYRILTGTFVGKDTAEKFAEELHKKYGWLIYVREA
ncbi:N-acetylmuramoyl-L-alanine amidase [Priestia filamentosa]|uniref:N-acetylmuramoyl-L-alanine amidase n=1 Tax=Priestia filamentosa TaxID=1402861 RepID=UPI000A090FDF|nr:N-acetylmuramoyl-L-alanine amidase [Priestia filamentosa]OXS69828.1 hypothetical protein B1B01_12820 [Priestia filamentosa]SMF36572.1 N-acetylmuramoyl-L-alanine amidase [Priestia filamentosa]